MSTTAPPNSSANASSNQAFKDWTRAELTVRGVRLSYLERDGPLEPAVASPILMLHGLVAGGDCFCALADQLSPAHRIIALDLPGGGFSDRIPTADLSFEAVAQLVADFIAELGLHQGSSARPILLGHSYGGAITLQLAASSPDLLDGIILIAPAHPFSGYENLLVRFYLSPPGRVFAHLLPRLPRRILLAGFRHMPGTPTNTTYEQLETYLETLCYPGTVDHILHLLETWKQDMRSLADALKRRPIALPTLLLWGDRDAIVPARTAPALTRHLLSAEQAIIPNATHLPNLDHPQECAALINAWLSSR